MAEKADACVEQKEQKELDKTEAVCLETDVPWNQRDASGLGACVAMTAFAFAVEAAVAFVAEVEKLVAESLVVVVVVVDIDNVVDKGVAVAAVLAVVVGKEKKQVENEKKRHDQTEPVLAVKQEVSSL